MEAAHIKEINEMRSKDNARQTIRPTVESLESVLYQIFSVLDEHGFVRVVDYMGDDSAIVQAARVSYGRGTKKTLEDQGLINYLMRHSHTTPFEMCEIKFHIKLPIFIARQWIRHRTANVNEYSARYSVLDKEFYIPAKENLACQSQSNKQGREDRILNEEEANYVLNILKTDAANCHDHYLDILNVDDAGNIIDESRQGLARELSRMNLTLNCYTQWYWKIDLHNLFHFLRLRADKHAQFEIREYARVMLDIVARWVPCAYEAFVKYKLDSAVFSATELQIIQRLIKDKECDISNISISSRELREFEKKIGLPLKDFKKN